MRYVIIDDTDVASINFDQVRELSASFLRYNNEKNKTFVKFEGETPSFLDGKTQYTHSEIITILTGPDWNLPLSPG